MNEEVTVLQQLNRRYQAKEEKQTLHFSLKENCNGYYQLDNPEVLSPMLFNTFTRPLSKKELSSICSFLGLSYKISQEFSHSIKRA